MDKSLIGKAKELEVASMLVDAGFYVFWPFVDKGYDLIVTNEEGRKFVPIQVKYRGEENTALALYKSDAVKFHGKEVFLAFLTGKQPNQKVWLLPFDKWEEMRVDRNRGDNLLYVTISKNEERLKAFEGDNGLSFLRAMFEEKK